MDWLSSLEPHYGWLAIGLVLAAAEMAIPGVFLIWLAGAAILTGLLVWVLPIGVPLQIVIFAVLAIVSVFLGKRYLGRQPGRFPPIRCSMIAAGSWWGRKWSSPTPSTAARARSAMAIPNGWPGPGRRAGHQDARFGA